MLKKINGVNVKFDKINKKGATSKYYISECKKYFLKEPINYLKYDILKREIFILEILKKYNKYFPKIIYYDDKCIITEYISSIKLTKESMPENWEEQINEILEILSYEKIRHCDIKYEEILLNDNNIFIVDFGWAKYKNTFSCEKRFCNLNKPCIDNRSDKEQLYSIIKKIIK